MKKKFKFGVSVKKRNEFNDYDYLDKLNDKELEYLWKFHQEYLQANFQNGKSLHRKKKHKKSCYDMNNSRNRDLYAIKLVNKDLYFGNQIGDKKWNPLKGFDFEDIILAQSIYNKRLTS